MTDVMEARAEAAALLGVALDAAEEAIEAAFRSAARTAHPDAGGTAEAFQAIEAARSVLLEPLPIEAGPERAEVPARAVRPELGPLRLGLLVVTPPLAAAVVIVAYVLAPGVGAALVAVYVVGVVAHAVYVGMGRPPLWRLLKSRYRR